MIKIILVLLILLVAFGGAKQVRRLKSVKTLNLLDQFLGSKPSARQVEAAQPYGNGDRQKLDIWAPTKISDAASAAMPIVIFFYGGGWEKGERADYAFVGKALADQGYMVVIPDYRLSPKAHFPLFIEDCALAVAWVQRHAAHYGADPDRIFLMGHSAGAYNAAMVALDRQWLRRAGGEADQLAGVIGLAGPYDFLPLKKNSQSDRAMGRYRPLERTQPIHFANADAPPFFLASGADDEMVSPRNSKALSDELQSLGGDTQLHLYDHLSHAGILMALAQPFRGKADILADILIFLQQKSGEINGRSAR